MTGACAPPAQHRSLRMAITAGHQLKRRSSACSYQCQGALEPMPDNMHDQLGKDREMGCSVEPPAGSWVREDVLPQCFPVSVPCKAAEMGQSAVCVASACKPFAPLAECCCQTPSACGNSPGGPAASCGSSTAGCRLDRQDLTFLATSCAISSQSTTETLCCLRVATTVLLAQAMPPVMPTSNIVPTNEPG